MTDFGWFVELGDVLAALLEAHAGGDGVGVFGFEAERAADVVGRLGELACSDVEAGKQEQRGDVGLQVVRSQGFGVGVGGVATGFADEGETDMGGGGARVSAEGGLELGFGFWQQVAGKRIVAGGNVLGRALRGRQDGEARVAELVELELGLAEAGLGVCAANAFHGGKTVYGVRREVLRSGASECDAGAELAGTSLSLGLSLSATSHCGERAGVCRPGGRVRRRGCIGNPRRWGRRRRLYGRGRLRPCSGGRARLPGC